MSKRFYKVGVVSDIDHHLPSLTFYFSHTAFRFVILYKNSVPYPIVNNAGTFNIWLEREFVPSAKKILENNPKCKILWFLGLDNASKIRTELPENVVILDNADFETDKFFFTLTPGEYRENKTNVLITRKNIEDEDMLEKYNYVLHWSPEQSEKFEVIPIGNDVDTQVVNMNIAEKDELAETIFIFR